MPFLFLALFIVVPLAEIAVFIQVGEAIGLLQTIIVVIVTALLGTWLLRAQGLAALTKAQTAVAEGRMPMESVMEGACLLFAGALLLTPGFITDAVGFALFVPGVCSFLARQAFGWFSRHANIHVSTSSSGMGPGSGGPGDDPRRGGGRPPSGDGPVIDGEYERVEPEDKRLKQRPGKPDANSPWRRAD